MAAAAPTKGHAPRMTSDEKTVIFASSMGTIFEWYDFYLFGAMASIMAKNFFSNLDPATGIIFTLLAFAAGFAVRPIGALVFGRLGDMAGRKYTFLITIMIMGVSTFLVGLIPTYDNIGLMAPVILIMLRLLQGLALGGEYGGAATYVAEHAPHGRRGFYTAWIQTTATVGLMLSLVVILGTRMSLGEKVFAEWGWRIPYLVSAVLLGVSLWIRLSLNESPAFARMKAEARLSASPLRESFGQWKNLRIVILALVGLTAGQSVVWYTGQFYVAIFLEQLMKVDGATTNVLVAAALCIGTPFFLVFGALSDRFGRKPIIMSGLLLASLTYFPLFHALAHYANPALERAELKHPILLSANPTTCSFQFNPIGTSKFTSPCDVAKAYLVRAGLNYETVRIRTGKPVTIQVGDTIVESYHAGYPNAVTEAPRFRKEMDTALREAGYPAKANDAEIDKGMVILLIGVMMIFVAMVYGPVAAMLVELFPTRIRYTAVSLPYHIGTGWFGGFLPATAFGIVAANGDVYSGLWYPIVIALVTMAIGVFFLGETKDLNIYDQD